MLCILSVVRIDLGETGWGDVGWIGLAQVRDRRRAVVNSVLNLRVPYNAGKLSSVLTTVGLSSGAQFHRVSLITTKTFVSTFPSQQLLQLCLSPSFPMLLSQTACVQGVTNCI
jgi:hypothetical protein